MARRFKWVKAILRELIEGGRNFQIRSNPGGTFRFVRLLKYNHGEGSSRFNRNRESRRAALADGAHKLLQNRSALREAFADLKDRVYQGVAIDSYDYVRILQGCSKQKDFGLLKQVHDCIKMGHMEQHLYVANNLLKCYIDCGRYDTAQEIFNKLMTKDAVTWTIMIRGCAEQNQVEVAIEMYNQMRNEGVLPNAITYMSALKACLTPTALNWGKYIHADIVRNGFQADLRICTALVLMYANCGSIEDARAVFRSMERRDVISWNVMIAGLAQHGLGHEAFSLFLQMQNEGFTRNEVTYVSILNPASCSGALEWVKEVHTHAIGAGLDVNVRVGTALVHMYAKSGSIENARVVFDRLERHDVISWNAMIGGLAQHELGHEAFSMFLRMQSEGFTPNVVTYVNILNPYSSKEASGWVKEVHVHAMEAGLDVDMRVGTALIHMYCKMGMIADARQVFDRLEKRNVISWTVIIGGLAAHGFGNEAFSLFLQMQREGSVPDSLTYLSILNPCSSEGALEWVKKVHAHVTQSGLDSNLRVANALVHMYAKCGSIEDARAVFDRIEKRDVISWTVMVGGLADYGLGHEAYSMFLQMQREGFTPNVVTYLSILNPCSNKGAMEWVKEVHAHAIKAGLDADVRVGNALVHMYAKIGFIADARQVFDKMLNPDVITWTAMMGGLAQHGYGREALQLFEMMKSKSAKPDRPLLVAVLSACSHAGLVDEGRLQFVSIRRDHGIEPDLKHYNCMVDILGRAGHLEEAKLLILNMPIKPNLVTWTALLGACRVHKNLKLAKLAANESLKLEPTDASSYVLLSNIYAAVGDWDQRSIVRRMMEERGIQKDPGRCWIEVDKKVHYFVSGDTLHPEATEIQARLTSLLDKLKAEGYIPDTRFILQNIDEEDQEGALGSHSEKLAIAYGLMHVPPEKPIRIYKNLRICTDCHTATKLISKVTGREIVARDAYRFHQFKDGSCSCGDYW